MKSIMDVAGDAYTQTAQEIRDKKIEKLIIENGVTKDHVIENQHQEIINLSIQLEENKNQKNYSEKVAKLLRDENNELKIKIEQQKAIIEKQEKNIKDLNEAYNVYQSTVLEQKEQQIEKAINSIKEKTLLIKTWMVSQATYKYIASKQAVELNVEEKDIKKMANEINEQLIDDYFPEDKAEIIEIMKQNVDKM